MIAPGTQLAKPACALKAAIGIGKQTLGNPRQSAGPQGPEQGPRPSWRPRAATRGERARLGGRGTSALIGLTVSTSHVGFRCVIRERNTP